MSVLSRRRRVYAWKRRHPDIFICGNHLPIGRWLEGSEEQTVELELFSSGQPNGTNKAGTLAAKIQVVPAGGEINSPRCESPTAPSAGVILFTPIKAHGLSSPNHIIRDLSAHQDNAGLNVAAALMLMCLLWESIYPSSTTHVCSVWLEVETAVMCVVDTY
jgi:hypothetical protein